MSTPDPLRPPERVTTRAITNSASRLERLKIKRRKLLAKLRVVDDDIRQAARLLRDVVRDTTAPQAGEQLTVDDLSAAADTAPASCGDCLLSFATAAALLDHMRGVHGWQG